MLLYGVQMAAGRQAVIIKQSTEPVAPLDVSGAGRRCLDRWTTRRRSEAQRPMRTVIIVVSDEAG